MMRAPTFAIVFWGFLGCSSSHAPRGTVETLIRDIDARDADGALEHMVSGDQLAKLVSCTTPASASWLSSDERKRKLADLRAVYVAAPLSKHVSLGPLFEEYDRPAQWHSYAAGDIVHGDCRAKAPFAIEVYRIVLVISEFNPEPIQSTKPIELWKIDGKYYAWDDPMDTEGWH